MLSSPANPQTRYFYEVNHKDDKAPPTIKFKTKISLPEIAGDYCVGNSEGLIVTLPTRCSPDIAAIDPFSGCRFPLPSTSTLPPFIPDDDWDEGFPITKTTEDQIYHAIKPVTGEKVSIDVNYLTLFQSLVTISPSRDMAILIRRCPYLRQQAYFTSLSASASKWAPLRLPPKINVLCDCIFHKDRVIFVNYEGTIATFLGTDDPFNPRPVLRYYYDLDNSNVVSPDTYRAYLVESPDGQDLFLVWRMDESCWPRPDSQPIKTNCIEVFRLDTNHGYKWKPVKSLEGLAFFIGTGRSVSVHAGDGNHVRPNSVYFLNDLPSYYYYLAPDGLGDSGVFNLQDDTVQPFQLTDEETELKWPPPVWIVPVAD